MSCPREYTWSTSPSPACLERYANCIQVFKNRVSYNSSLLSVSFYLFDILGSCVKSSEFGGRWLSISTVSWTYEPAVIIGICFIEMRLLYSTRDYIY